MQELQTIADGIANGGKYATKMSTSYFVQLLEGTWIDTKQIEYIAQERPEVTRIGLKSGASFLVGSTPEAVLATIQKAAQLVNQGR